MTPRRTEIPTREVAAALKLLILAMKPVVGWGTLSCAFVTVLFAWTAFNSDVSLAGRISSGVASLAWFFFTLRSVITWRTMQDTLQKAIRSEARP